MNISRFLPIILGFFIMCGCSTLGLPEKEPSTLPDVEHAGSHKKALDFVKHDGTGDDKKIPSLYYDFLTALDSVQADKENEDKIKDMIDAGVAVSNEACADWFAHHNASFEQVERQQGIINILGNMLVAALGIEEASTNTMGYVALALGGVNAGYETFKSDFFLSGTIWKLEKGVRTGRLELANTLKEGVSGENKYNYYTARDALRQYHNTCSRLQLIAYVEESVELTRYVPVDQKFDDIATKTQATSLNEDLFSIVRGRSGSFPEERLKQIYEIFKAPKSEGAQNLLNSDDYLKDIYDRLEALRKGDENQKAQAMRFIDILDKLGALTGLNEALAKKDENIEEKQKELDEMIKEKEGETENQTGMQLQNFPISPQEAEPDPEVVRLRKELENLKKSGLKVRSKDTEKTIGLGAVPR